jgi:eukaryotic-like serine/threonine-protein kinase
MLLGWSVTRWIGGQSAFTTLHVTSADIAVDTHGDPLGFTVPVPRGWQPDRAGLPSGVPAASFVSPDRSEELAVERVDSEQKALTRLGSTPGPVKTRTDGSREISFDSDERTSWRRVVPAGEQFWIVTLTVPHDTAGDKSEKLFEKLAKGFLITTA